MIKQTHCRLLDMLSVEIFEGKTKTIFVPLCGKAIDMLW